MRLRDCLLELKGDPDELIDLSEENIDLSFLKSTNFESLYLLVHHS